MRQLLLAGFAGHLREAPDAQAVLAAAQTTLRESHGIHHATLQVEANPAKECHSATW